MRISKENQVLMAGVGFFTVSTVSMIAGTGYFSSWEATQKIQSRKDDLATSIGRPLNRDLSKARVDALPVEYQSNESYFGNGNDCSRVRRAMIPQVDSACEILAIGQQKEPAWQKIIGDDPELNRLNGESENKNHGYLLSLVLGLSGAFGSIAVLQRSKSIAARWELIQKTSDQKLTQLSK